MSKLRVRGKTSVFQTILLKIAGWNIFQAAASEKARRYVAEMMAIARRRVKEYEIKGTLLNIQHNL